MWRFLFLFCVVAAVFVATLGAGSVLQAESITYYLVDYPDDQDGWTLEGHITTDGTMGLLEEDDILAWSWMASKDQLSYEYNSENPSPAVVLTGSILADATTISIPAPSDPGPGYPYPYLEDNNLRLGATSGYPFLYWQTYLRTFGPIVPAIQLHGYYEAYNTSGDALWRTWSFWPSEMVQHGRVIARVPEPGTLTLLATMTLWGALVLTGNRKW